MKIFCVGGVLLTLAVPLAHAENDSYVQEPFPESSPSQFWNAELAQGWDSLYMYRGLNCIKNELPYGLSILWTDLSLTAHVTASDSWNLEIWNVLGLGQTHYKETDFTLTYARTWGKLFASLGYAFFFQSDGHLYTNELQGKLGYNIAIRGATLTPSLFYSFELGPNASTDIHGSRPSCSSFLELRLEGSLPLYKKILSLAPWITYGENFRYNQRTTNSGEPQYFNGANNIECGIALPIQINKILSVTGYGAYSYNIAGLVDTNPSTFWSGAKVTLAF